MRRSLFTFCLTLSILLGWNPSGLAEDCDPGLLGEISLTDECIASSFVGGRLCIATPKEGDNIDRDTICVFGQFLSVTDVQALVDFVAALSLPTNLDEVQDSVSNSEIPEIGSDGTFQIPLTTSRPGTYQVILHADFYEGGGSDPIERISEIRQITRIDKPHFTVAAARENGAATQTDYLVTPLDDLDGDGILNGDDTDFDNDGLSDNLDPDDDNDGICDERVSIAGTCVAGDEPDPVPTEGAHITAPPQILGGVSASSLDLCLKSVTSNPTSGTELTFTVTNEVVQTEGGLEKRFLNETVVTSVEAPLRSSGFCLGGHVVTVPLGNGENRLFVDVDSAATAGNAPSRISLDPIQNDIRGPTLCVAYLDANGKVIPNVEGKVLDASRQAVTIDVTVCGDVPDQLQTCLTGSSVCLQYHNDSNDDDTPEFLAMQTVRQGGRDHYRASFDHLRFPVNTFTLKARDIAGNETLETHSFGYGSVRSTASPEAFSAFLPASYVKGELKDLILKILNSQKFKDETFLKLFEPKVIDEEILERIQDDGGCPEVFSADRVRVLKILDHSIDQFEIPSIDLLSQNRIRIVLAIKGLQGNAEVFTVQTGDIESDGDPSDLSFPGEPVDDPVFETGVLPIQLDVEELKLNLQLRLLKQNGRLKFEISNIPNEELVESDHLSCGSGDPMIRFECGRTALSETLFDGNRWPINEEECRSVEDLNRTVCSEGRDASCFNQSLDEQFLFTLKEIVWRLLPHEIEEELARRETERLTDFSIDLLDKQISFDLFANLSEADVQVTPAGLFFSTAALLAPSGMTDDPAFQGLGPIREPEAEEPVDPADAASFMGGELNAALSEELINSFLLSANFLLNDLVKGDPDFLDLSVSRIRELGLAAHPLTAEGIGGSGCLDEAGIDVEGGDPTDDWKCFPFNLEMAEVFGSGRIPGIADTSPVVIRTKLNPLAPLTIRLVNFSTAGTSNIAEFEVGIRDTDLWLYEGRFDPTQTVGPGPAVVIQDTCDGSLKSHPDCGSDEEVPLAKFKMSGRLYITADFRLKPDGRLVVRTGLTSTTDDPPPVDPDSGTYYGSLSDPKLDEARSYLNLSIVENNTIVRDQDDLKNSANKGLVQAFQKNIETLLQKYLMNTARTIRFEVPLSAPDQDPKEMSAIEEIWEDLDLNAFGITTLKIDELEFGMTGSAHYSEDQDEVLASFNDAPRYLLLGLESFLGTKKRSSAATFTLSTRTATKTTRTTTTLKANVKATPTTTWTINTKKPLTATVTPKVNTTVTASPKVNRILLFLTQPFFKPVDNGVMRLKLK